MVKLRVDHCLNHISTALSQSGVILQILDKRKRFPRLYGNFPEVNLLALAPFANQNISCFYNTVAVCSDVKINGKSPLIGQFEPVCVRAVVCYRYLNKNRVLFQVIYPFVKITDAEINPRLCRGKQ